MQVKATVLRVLNLVAILAVGLTRADAMAADLANGIFLVAKREMRDPRFQETVVLVTQPPQGGPFGVIVNRPLPRLLSEVFTQHPALKGRKDVLFRGGPVAPDSPIFLVRTSQPPTRSVHVLPDVYFVGDADWIDALLKRPDPTRGVRVFAGYSGWAVGQLQNEMQRGDWYVLPADAETIFEKDVARIWPDLVQRASARPTRHLVPAGAGTVL
jgi:putative transcriptional regulator